MNANLPSSFASAAAGQNANRDARGNRGEGRVGSGGEWTRRDGRPNGTLTFRRSSTAPGQTSQAATPSDILQTNPIDTSVGSQAPPVSAYDLAPQPSQYDKHMILEVFGDVPQADVTDVLEPNWTPGQVNGNASRGWGKSGHSHANQDPNSCWTSNPVNEPNGTRALTSEEKEILASDVNSPLKPPNQKEGNQQTGANGRKASVSHGSGPGFGLTSPTSASRPGTRRRDTVDQHPFAAGLSSPAGTGRFNRDDSFMLGRKATEPREQESEDEGGGSTRETPQRGGFGGLMRSNTAGSAGMQGSNISSLWGSSNQAQQPASSGASLGSFGQFALPTPSNIGGSARGGSRFANLMSKDGAEGQSGKTDEGANNADMSRSWRSRPRTDTDPFGEEGLSGSAALGGAKDTSPPPMPNPATQPPGAFETPVKGSAGDFGMSGLNLGTAGDDQGPISPETNPYRSPPAERGEEHDSADRQQQQQQQQQQHQVLGSEQNPNFGSLSRGFPGAHAFEGSDRSQTSSTGAKNYHPLANLTGGWPAPGPSATPDRERQGFGGAFGNTLFGQMGSDMQSPGLGGIGGGVFGPPSAGGIGATGSMGRSKLGSLFPPAMQAQMQGHDQQLPENMSDSVPDFRQANPLGAIGRGNLAPQRGESESPMRAGRGVFDELFSEPGENKGPGAFGNIGGGAMVGMPGSSQPQSFTPVGSSSIDLPTTQVRQMVMPDRMRWEYQDPQGFTQGPFTGLEMNDWYKANFFTPDLRVKKAEDTEFEPLGQLIRRIGNSREPFLVPQVGIAHGPAPPPGGPPAAPFAPTNPGGVVPPLSGLFPSYGRTLTAEEQNNLERRKQEEQFAMAQQREAMMRQQAIARMQPGGVQGSLHHHSSAHSLQSQPSFGSIASPIGAPHQQPPTSTSMASASGMFEGGIPAAQHQQGTPAQAPGQTPSGGAPMSSFRDDDLSRLNPTERQMLANVHGSPASFFPPQPIGAPATDSQLRSGLPGTEQLSQDDEGFRDRLKEFEGLRAERDAENQQQQDDNDNNLATAEHFNFESQDSDQEPHQLSLTQQVQQTQAAAEAAKHQSAIGLPSSFPPPQSGTPLPAPTAQRVHSNLPDQYNRSQTGSPDTSSVTEPPPTAPWAKEAGPGGRKGPSLKEIQETEARNAAKAEEAAAAARRVALEQEALAIREREKVTTTAPGLPTTSTWGNGSPVSSGSSPWIKPGPVKAASGGPSAGTTAKQKTLADIQREEEARKEKAAKTNVTQSPGVSATGKRYADLATRPGQSPVFSSPQQQVQAQPAAAPAPPPGSGWATVGAGGRVKIPTGPAAQTPSRSSSTSYAKPVAAPPKPAAAKPAPAPVPSGKNDAMDEFKQWLHRELSRDISGVDIDQFASMLMTFPLEQTLISDAVYGNSKTMNGQHFAEEFIRRKKRAEQGFFDKPVAADSKAGGGWSEVAKKGSGSTSGPIPGAPAKESTGDAAMQGAGFKVVPGRKKGGKK